MTVDEIDALNKQVWDICDNDARHALDLAVRARREAEQIGYRRGVAFGLCNIGSCHAALLDYVSALPALLAALDLYRELGDVSGEARVLNLVGNIHFRLNDYEAALDGYTRSMELRQQIGDRCGEAASLNNIGLVYFDMARYLDAHEYHSQSLEIHEAAGNGAGAARALNNLGLVYYTLGDMQSALDCHRRSLELKRSLGNLSGVEASLNNLGDLYRRMGDYRQALDYSQQSLESARQTGHRYNEAQALINLGQAHQAMSDLEKAMTYYDAGLEILSGAGDAMTHAETLLNIGDNYLQRGLPDQAMVHVRKALRLGESIGSHDLISRAHQALAAVYEAQSDLACALEHYKLFHQIRTRLFTEEFDHRRKVLQIQAEIDRVKSEAEIHRLKNVELARAYCDLQQADEQKADLLRTLEQQARELERLSHEDPLTGVSNRRHVDKLAALEYERAWRYGHDLTVAMVDVDNFKQINDSHSHQLGDVVLRTVAQLLRGGCRAVDVVGRYGGEEFLLVLVEAGRDETQPLCERLRATVQGHDWATLSPGLAVTISIGLADNREAAGLDEILALADARLYHAKQEGKNQVHARD